MSAATKQLLRFFLLLFGRFVNLHYLCGRKKQSIMKDIDKESRFNEEENVGMTAEPIGAAVRSDVSSLGYNIDNWPGMPLVGPDNVEEMNARIDLAEQEIDNNTGFSWEQVMTDAQSIVNRYAATVY